MNKIEELKRLKSLLDQGAINETEYNNLISKIIDEESNTSEYELKAVSESLQKLKKRTNTLKNWGVVMAVLLTGILLIEGVNNYTSIKRFVEGIAGNTKTQDVINKNDSTTAADRNIIFQDGKEIGRIVKRDFVTIYPHSGVGVTTMDIPKGKMWTPLYYDFINGKPDYYEVTIYPVKRNNGWTVADSYEFEDSKYFFVSVKYAKQFYRPLTEKTNPAVQVFAYVQTTCTIYFFEESIDY